MKKFIVLSTLLLLIGNGFAQISPIFSYQAVVRNTADELVVSDRIDAIIKFYNDSPFSSPVYAEHHSVLTNQNGLVSFLVGQGDPISGDLHSVAWDKAYARTEFILQDGTSIADTLPITPIPYAYFAQRIPLQAIEEHLGSTNFISKEHLRDTLNQFATNEHLRDTLDQFITNEHLRDTLDQFITNKHLRDTLQNYISSNDFDIQMQSLRNAIDAIQTAQNLRNIIQEFNVNTTGQVSFSLNHEPNDLFAIQMFVNGVFITAQAFSAEGNRITYYPNLNGGKQLKINDRIQFYYFY